MEPTNLVIVCSDEHARAVTGCYGHALVRTPALDRLAAGGVRFDAAYTPSPMCVPARASLATGRYVHRLGTWSSAEPYPGQPESWGHRLMAAGHRCVSVGKLHYRSAEDANGFDPELLAMHVVDGIGWTKGLMRTEPLPPYDESRDFAQHIGRGTSAYAGYDRQVAETAVRWLAEEGTRATGRPWVLFVSFVSPHYPLMAPEAFYDLYDGVDVGEPAAYAAEERPHHPVLDRLAGCRGWRVAASPRPRGCSMSATTARCWATTGCGPRW
jgi:choline-sulfatase